MGKTKTLPKRDTRDDVLRLLPEKITRNQLFCMTLRFFEAFGRLEPEEGKLSCPVLRGGEAGNVLSLPNRDEG